MVLNLTKNLTLISVVYDKTLQSSDKMEYSNCKLNPSFSVFYAKVSDNPQENGHFTPYLILKVYSPQIEYRNEDFKLSEMYLENVNRLQIK